VFVDREMRVGDRKGSCEAEVVGAEVAEALLDRGRALSDRDGAEGEGGVRIGDLANGVVAVVDDEEIAAAIDSDTEGVADLGEIAESAVACIACGAGARDGGDVAAAAGGGGVDGIDAICPGVGDVEVACCIDRERGGRDQCSAGGLSGNGGGCASVAGNLVDDTGFVHGVDEVGGGVRDVEDAVEIHGEAAGRNKTGGDDATRTGGVDLDHVMGCACLSDEEIVEAIDVDRSWRVESGDVASVDAAICAESGDGAVGGVCDEEVAGRIDCKGGGSEQTGALRDHDLGCATAGRNEEKVGGARGAAGFENVGVAGGVDRDCVRSCQRTGNGIDDAGREDTERACGDGLQSLENICAGDGVGQFDWSTAKPGTSGSEAEEDLAGVGYCASGRGAERAAASVAGNGEVGAGVGGEIDILIDDEGEGHRRALAADWSGREDDIAVEFARDAVAGVGEGEVAEAIDGDAAGSVERGA
jgi:hypothetical protein